MLARFVALVGLVSALGFADAKPTYPAKVLIIRHAEKPTDDTSPDLSPMGKKRAEALPELFVKSAKRPDPLTKPDFIFATKVSKHSNRPVETVTPLAKKLKLDIDSQFANDDFGNLAAELLYKPKYEGKVVLVCWHHGKIPELAGMLKVDDAPDKWKDEVFDRVWAVTYEHGKGKLTKLHQMLLPGDSDSDK